MAVNIRFLQRFMFRIVALFFCLGFTFLNAQVVTLAYQSFEGNAADTWNYTAPFQNAALPQVSVGAANYGAGYAKEGANSMRIGGGSTSCGTGSANCLNGDSNGGRCSDNLNGGQITFEPINIACYYDVKVSVAYRTHNNCTPSNPTANGTGMDDEERIFFEISEDGAPYSIAATIVGADDCRWDYTLNSVVCGSNPATANPFVYPVPETIPRKSTVSLRVRLQINRSDEVLYLDDIKITGKFGGTFSYPPISCAAYVNPFPPLIPSFAIAQVGGDGLGQFSAVPAGLTLNAFSGNITPGLSAPGTYNVTYSRFGQDCFTLPVTVGPITTTPIFHD
jgi:hypothetical protein